MNKQRYINKNSTVQFVRWCMRCSGSGYIKAMNDFRPSINAGYKDSKFIMHLIKNTETLLPSLLNIVSHLLCNIK